MKTALSDRLNVWGKVPSASSAILHLSFDELETDDQILGLTIWLGSMRAPRLLSAARTGLALARAAISGLQGQGKVASGTLVDVVALAPTKVPRRLAKSVMAKL